MRELNKRVTLLGAQTSAFSSVAARQAPRRYYDRRGGGGDPVADSAVA